MRKGKKCSFRKSIKSKPILLPHRYLFALHSLPRIPIWEFKKKRLCKRILAPLSVPSIRILSELFLNFEFSS